MKRILLAGALAAASLGVGLPAATANPCDQTVELFCGGGCVPDNPCWIQYECHVFAVGKCVL